LLNLLQDLDVFAEKFEVGNKPVAMEPEKESFLCWVPINEVEACFAIPNNRAAKFDANLIYQIIR
jgi:hypothetical protein